MGDLGRMPVSGFQLKAWAAAVAAVVCLAGEPALAEELGDLTAMVADPCSGIVDHPMDQSLLPILQPGSRLLPPPADPDAIKAMIDQRARDWPNLCRYRAANAALKQAPDAVFMGDSITEAWAIADPGFFTGGLVGRGISGQTSPQMLLRFRADVVALKPRVVHILAGTNDIAGNTGPTSERAFQDNIESMVELAKAHHIQVVLASILPMDSLSWAPRYRPAEEVRRLNRWLRSYAATAGVTYLDYYSLLTTPEGGFRKDLSNDGVHPNLAGYAIMRKLANQALKTK
jgi:lysophospholipase L1-like esterase